MGNRHAKRQPLPEPVQKPQPQLKCAYCFQRQPEIGWQHRIEECGDMITLFERLETRLYMTTLCKEPLWLVNAVIVCVHLLYDDHYMLALDRFAQPFFHLAAGIDAERWSWRRVTIYVYREGETPPEEMKKPLIHSIIAHVDGCTAPQASPGHS